jgi:hypothetical protein
MSASLPRARFTRPRYDWTGPGVATPSTLEALRLRPRRAWLRTAGKSRSIQPSHVHQAPPASSRSCTRDARTRERCDDGDGDERKACRPSFRKRLLSPTPTAALSLSKRHFRGVHCTGAFITRAAPTAYKETRKCFRFQRCCTHYQPSLGLLRTSCRGLRRVHGWCIGSRERRLESGLLSSVYATFVAAPC